MGAFNAQQVHDAVQLGLILTFGLLGPILAGPKYKGISTPVVVGEILGGIVLGPMCLGILDLQSVFLAYLAQLGFILLMLAVGTHLPLHDPNLKKALGKGFISTALSFAFALPAGYLLAHYSSVNNMAMFVLILANSSAAMAMPIVHERKLSGTIIVATTTWIAIADAITIVALPLGMGTGPVLPKIVGVLSVLGAAAICFLVALSMRNSKYFQYYHQQSKDRGWALALRLSLILVIWLSAIAFRFNVSILVSGFAAGAIINLLDQPDRLSMQITAVADGFFIPIFYLNLGAQLDFRSLLLSPADLQLTGYIVLATVVVHLIVSKFVRLPLGSALAASAQLGLPAAVASIGLAAHSLSNSQAAAIIAASMVSLAVCTVGCSLLSKFSNSEAGSNESK